MTLLLGLSLALHLYLGVRLVTDLPGVWGSVLLVLLLVASALFVTELLLVREDHRAA